MRLGFKRVLLGARVAASENTLHFAEHPLWAGYPFCATHPKTAYAVSRS